MQVPDRRHVEKKDRKKWCGETGWNRENKLELKSKGPPIGDWTVRKEKIGREVSRDKLMTSGEAGE